MNLMSIQQQQIATLYSHWHLAGLPPRRAMSTLPPTTSSMPQGEAITTPSMANRASRLWDKLRTKRTHFLLGLGWMCVASLALELRQTRRDAQDLQRHVAYRKRKLIEGSKSSGDVALEDMSSAALPRQAPSPMPATAAGTSDGGKERQSTANRIY
jgi:hypothetical protein